MRSGQIRPQELKHNTSKGLRGPEERQLLLTALYFRQMFTYSIALLKKGLNSQDIQK
jgi:hypothetical protein